MASTSSKTDVMEPLFVKAGIPLALSVAGFVFARIVLRRSTIAKPFPLQTTVSSVSDTIDSSDDFIDEEGIHSPQSTSSPIKDDDQEHMLSCSQDSSSTVASHIQFEEEILGLKNEIEELQNREHSLSMQFLGYRVMKEQDTVLMELNNMVLLETAHVKLLDREISAIEAQARGLENFVVVCRRVLEEVKRTQTINGLEAEIMRICDVLEMRTNVINKLDDEVRESEAAVNRLQEEKNDLLVKLIAAESQDSLISKIEAEGAGMEDYNRLVSELEKLQKDRASETTELIYLRWSNACLRHELMRSHGQQQLQIEDRKKYLELELEEPCREIADCDQEQQHEEPCLGVAGSSKTFSKEEKVAKKAEEMGGRG
ncbi:hypothetical protein OIU84_006230 [Salix udensis]|uniref:Protein CHUP1, chloroplastic n=1 Tax=Salix udensis TaxID=889485 RepID=A0AAD6K094_9ROSI|nr:hypothetical protein OIU84_006230 [Salix udensis]